MNQGMLMESLNLAAVWKLPVLFVCKDDGWSITTRSSEMTAGELSDRARGLGVPTVCADGRDVSEVWEACGSAIARARSGGGPTFLHARCVHLEGHFLGFQLLRIVRDPLREISKISLPLTRSLLHLGGAPLGDRLAGLGEVLGAVLATIRDPRRDQLSDPVWRARKLLEREPSRLRDLEDRAEGEVSDALASALGEVPA